MTVSAGRLSIKYGCNSSSYYSYVLQQKCKIAGDSVATSAVDVPLTRELRRQDTINESIFNFSVSEVLFESKFQYDNVKDPVMTKNRVGSVVSHRHKTHYDSVLQLIQSVVLQSGTEPTLPLKPQPAHFMVISSILRTSVTLLRHTSTTVASFTSNRIDNRLE